VARTSGLIGNGTWTVGSIVYVYLVIVSGMSGIKAGIPKHPEHGGRP
jgi:hypothetical protein